MNIWRREAIIIQLAFDEIKVVLIFWNVLDVLRFLSEPTFWALGFLSYFFFVPLDEEFEGHDKWSDQQELLYVLVLLHLWDAHPFDVSYFHSGIVVRVEFKILVYTHNHIKCFTFIFEVVRDHIVLRNQRTYVDPNLLSYFSDSTGDTIFSFVDFAFGESIVFVGIVRD